MAVSNLAIQQLLKKTQGPAARALDKLPDLAKESIAKALGYSYIYPQLDPLVKCLMAIQHKQGKFGLITDQPLKDREGFEKQIAELTAKKTPIKHVEDIRLPLQSGTITARHYHPDPQKKLPLIMFYHGGGFVIGSLNTHDEVCRLIAKYANTQVISIDYPLAPEVGPKQIIQCCEDALAWAYQNRKQLKIYKNRIAVAGDSAGANISAVVAQRTVNKAYKPSAQLLIYPVVDFKSRHPSFYNYNEGLVLTKDDVDRVTEFYAIRHHIELDDPMISPTYGELKHLPPTFILTAGHDVLHDEGKIYSHKLRQQGVKVRYQEFKDQAHGFVNLTLVSGKAKKYTIQIAKDFRKFWNKAA